MPGHTTQRLTEADVDTLFELIRVSLDDKALLDWHKRLREVRDKMIETLGVLVRGDADAHEVGNHTCASSGRSNCKPCMQFEVDLWDAINRYAATIGGNPSQHVYGNVPRMQAVADVGAVTQRLRDELAWRTKEARAPVLALARQSPGKPR